MQKNARVSYFSFVSFTLYVILTIGMKPKAVNLQEVYFDEDNQG
jgi:hypothetical protein